MDNIVIYYPYLTPGHRIHILGLSDPRSLSPRVNRPLQDSVTPSQSRRQQSSHTSAAVKSERDLMNGHFDYGLLSTVEPRLTDTPQQRTPTSVLYYLWLYAGRECYAEANTTSNSANLMSSC